MGRSARARRDRSRVALTTVCSWFAESPVIAANPCILVARPSFEEMLDLQALPAIPAKLSFCLPCRRSWVRVPSAALEKPCKSQGFFVSRTRRSVSKARLLVPQRSPTPREFRQLPKTPVGMRLLDPFELTTVCVRDRRSFVRRCADPKRHARALVLARPDKDHHHYAVPDSARGPRLGGADP
jgi:hypothetical protein